MIDLGAFAPSTPRAVDHMPAPSGAPPLMLGRERDVAELDGALEFAAQGTPQVVIVGGDAGIGKTTLVSDLERRAAGRGFTVATGHCLDIEAGMSFAPVVEAVRALLTGLDDLGSRPSARRMLRLLDPEAPRSTEPFRVLDDLRQTVLEAAAAGPVLVVLEDMHWSDRSTQDFATSLSQSARGGLLLVLTFRSDELHRRHPFRKTLTEISRTFGCRRIDLGGLDRDDIAGLVAARTDGPADPAVVGAVLARSGATPCTPRSSWRRTSRGSRVTCPICCWPGSTPSTRVRGRCSAWPRSTAPGWTPPHSPSWRDSTKRRRRAICGRRWTPTCCARAQSPSSSGTRCCARRRTTI